ncbi:MAG: hypothetical protein IH897_03635, partial [Planctomycetes bacterium]|nr:hypothetical protein [Planctomycetota bacterium]
FTSKGKIGLWTKADAVTSFDDVTVRIPEKRESTAGGRAVLLWQSRHTTTPPNVDGVVDKVWRIAEPLTVVVREAVGGHNPKSVILRALHTDDTLYVLAQWPDATRSDMRDPYVWNANQKTYERPSKPDDQFALEFPIKGDFHVNMLAMSRDYTADVWHWKAGRGNPVGWVDDKRHIISQRRIEGAKRYDLGGHDTVYIARPMDEGTPSYKVKPKPESHEGDTVPSYEPQEPSGSVADVRGKGVHDGAGWTLEMARNFDTGNSDDAVIDPAAGITCAVAVLDDELYWNHSVSQFIQLRFAAPPGANARLENGSAVFRFESSRAGTLPDAWRVEATRPDGPLATWQVASDLSAPTPSKVLSMIRPNHQARGTYNLCWRDDVQFEDGEILLHFKANEGEVDQGGGPIWRAKDSDNYYVCRANPLEDNFRLYYVKDGVRHQIATADAEIPPGIWHTIKVIHQGNRIECHLDGTKLLEVTDDTFAGRGGVGLWTKADAATSFDNFVITGK